MSSKLQHMCMPISTQKNVAGYDSIVDKNMIK
jgi:hypothetical protein